MEEVSWTWRAARPWSRRAGKKERRRERSAERIYALVMRHIYTLAQLGHALVDSIYCPAVQMVMWIHDPVLLPQASFVAQGGGCPAVGACCSGKMVVRGNLSLSIAFLENVVAQPRPSVREPIRSWEMRPASSIAALLRTLLGLFRCR